MAKQENYISLKEASKLSGYSPDYIGQLIRSGKISGKQVYTSISWMTTPEAVMAYKNGKDKSVKEDGFWSYINTKKRKIALELDLVFLFLRTFRAVMPILAILIISFFALVYFMLNSFNSEGNFISNNQFLKESQDNFSF